MSALVWIGVVLLVLWLAGWLVFEIAGGIIHLLLVVAVVLVVWGLIKRGATAVK